jgi:hypothetical protein
VKFNYHGNLEGRHALLSPSSYSWINYDEDKLTERLVTMRAAALGTKKHQFAHDAITLGIIQQKNGLTLNSYINDVIRYRMTPEQIVRYSDNFFGTADALGFRKDRGEELYTLRVFDLKTGVSKASVNQLLIYCALFFLEYGDVLGIKPFDVNYDLRIYQHDEPAQKFIVDPKDVIYIMDKIKTFERLINESREREDA